MRTDPFDFKLTWTETLFLLQTMKRLNLFTTATYWHARSLLAAQGPRHDE